MERFVHRQVEGRGRTDALWVMTQEWRDLLFAHWAVPASVLRGLVPEPLDVDTFAGSGWLGVVAFRLGAVTLRGLPAIPFAGGFPEVNLRTYARFEGRPGVCFVSLDAENPLAVTVGRRCFGLPYHRANVGFGGAGARRWLCSRRFGTQAGMGEIVATYAPVTDLPVEESDTLARWLTDRFCYYWVGGNKQVIRGDIAHVPWQLYRARANISVNTLAQSVGVSLPPEKPLLYYSLGMRTRFWLPCRADEPSYARLPAEVRTVHGVVG